jgi:type I restriction enzyme S subunit
MRTKNVQVQLDLSDVWAVDRALVRRSEQSLRFGDILVSSANSWNLVGKCCWVPDLPWPASFGGFISVLRAEPDRIDPRFLFRWFASEPVQTVVRTLGQQTTNISNLNVERTLRLTIPLPPLSDQHRIAELLDRADAIRAKRRTALAELDTLTLSIFLDMFGDPLRNPNRLRVGPLAELCLRITDGTHQPPPWSVSGHPFLFVSNIVSGELNFDTKKFISDETHKQLMKHCPIEFGDVLYSTVGSYGVPVLVDTERKFAFQRHIAHLKPDKAKVDPSFLRWMLASPPLQVQADRVARGVAQKTVNLADIKRFLAFHPPLALQREFARRAALVGNLKVAHRKSLVLLNALFASLQHRAFRGEL